MKETYSRNGQAVRDLLHDRARRGESRGRNVGTGVAVDHHRSHNVHDRVNDLQHGQRSREHLHVLHFRHDTEERDVGNKGKDNVRHGQEGIGEAGRGGDVVLDVVRCLHADGDHGDDGRDQDTDGRDGGHDEDLVRGSRECTEEADDQTDNSKDHGAGAVVGDRVEQHGECKDVAGHQEDDEQELAEVENFPSDRSKQHLTRITHTVHMGIAQLELAHDISGVP